MEILHKEHNGEGKFYTVQDNEQLAEMAYVLRDKTLIILHTEVDDRLKGQGAGLKLLDATVDYARKKELKIIPLCPYAKHQMEKLEQYHDILAQRP